MTEERKPIDAIEVLKATTAGLFAGAAALAPGGPIAVALVGVAGAAGASLYNAFADRSRLQREQAGKAWFEAMAMAEGATPEHVAETIRDRLDDPDTMRVISEHARKLLEIDPALAPALGALTAEYLRKKPDGFFRGATGLLADLTVHEAKTLRAILQYVESRSEDAMFLEVSSNATNVASDDEVMHLTHLTLRSGTITESTSDVGEFHDPLRLFALLRKHLLGREGTATTGIYATNATTPNAVQLEKSTVTRLSRLLRAV